MTVRFDEGVLRLEGDCHVEEAEAVLRFVQDDGLQGVDLSLCRQLHTAVVQVLLSHAAPIVAEPEDAFLRDHVLPNLHHPTGRCE